MPCLELDASWTVGFARPLARCPLWTKFVLLLICTHQPVVRPRSVPSLYGGGYSDFLRIRIQGILYRETGH